MTKFIGLIGLGLFLGITGTLFVLEVAPTGSNSRAAGTNVISPPVPTPEEDLIMAGEWLSTPDENSRITYLVKGTTDPARMKRVTLTIVGREGEALFRDSYSEVTRVYRTYALRSPIPQLVIEYSGGGQDRFLMMLDYREGKIVNLTKDEALDMSFRSDAHVTPRFAESVDSTREPYQVLLTNDGLAGPGEKYVSVFRYRNGQYRSVGEYSRTKADDYLDKLIAPSGHTGKPRTE